MKSLDVRMKEYELAYKYKLTPRSYVIIRLDGKNFSKYTAKLEKPFDSDLSDAMNETAKALCDEFNCKFAYTQSDEISLVITDIGNLEAEMIHGGSIQKLCSLTASVATAKFNEVRNMQYLMGLNKEMLMDSIDKEFVLDLPKQAYFDARVFIVPNQIEVVNYMIFRQQDGTRNSVSMAAHALLGHKATMNKSGAEKQEMMFQERGVNWNDYPTKFKRGVVIFKETYYKDVLLPYSNDDIPVMVTAQRTRWSVDTETPIFTQDKEYLLNLIPTN